MNDGPCSVDGCDAAAQCRGWCGSHYQRWRRNGHPTEQPPDRKRARTVGVATCSVTGCEKTVAARGWCGTHYGRWQRTGDPINIVRPVTGRKRTRTTPPCSVDDCETQSWARGWCIKHYSRWRQYGDPLLLKPREEWSVRPRTNRIDPCSIDGCESVQIARGLCSLHWERWKRLGDPLGRLQGEVVDGKRVCPRCSLDKPLSDYGSGSRCMACVADLQRAYRQANPDVVWQQAAERRARKLAALVETFPRIEIFERDEWTCGLCGEDIDPSVAYPDPWSPSIDHVLPLSKGGTHERGNVQAAHFRCNLQKSNRVLSSA